MGRKKSIEIRKYFKKNINDDNYVCQLPNCDVSLKGNHITNMSRHIEKKHQNIYIAIQIKDANLEKIKKRATQSVQINISETQIWEGCLELATSYPLSFITHKGFKKIINPITAKLNIEHQFNIPNLKEKLVETAQIIRTQIKENLKNKLISVKIDSVTRHARGILGINVQYINDFKIKIKTLAMRELTEKHTAVYIKTVIQNVLKEYNISLKQVYTITSDNGRNMLKAKDLLKEALQEEFLEEEMENATHQDLIELDDVANMLIRDSTNLINCIRCAAHSVQLVVNDAIKAENLAEKILQCRRLAVALRKPNNTLKLESAKLHKAILNNVTRWNSTYDMIERLLELKDFCNEYQNEDEDLYLEESVWQFMLDFQLVFKPLKITTLKLQEEQLPLSDFYKVWLGLKIEVRTVNNSIAKSVSDIIERREKILLSNPVLLSALFLDPRFQFTLKNEENVIAKNHLKSLFVNSISVEHATAELPLSSPIASTSSSLSIQNTFFNNNEAVDIDTQISEYLNEIQQSQIQPSIHNERDKCFLEIDNYLPERIQDLSLNILSYWKIKAAEYPHLGKLAVIVHAVPATQVSVERCFSTLKMVLADQRNRLSDINLENILMIKLNNEFNT